MELNELQDKSRMEIIKIPMTCSQTLIHISIHIERVKDGAKEFKENAENLNKKTCRDYMKVKLGGGL